MEIFIIWKIDDKKKLQKRQTKQDGQMIEGSHIYFDFITSCWVLLRQQDSWKLNVLNIQVYGYLTRINYINGLIYFFYKLGKRSKLKKRYGHIRLG